MPIQSYRDLEAWQLAIETVNITYRLIRRFPAEERYALADQMRRAAVSVPSNIAEGSARRSLKAYLNHLGIALGSLGELDTELEIAERLGHCTREGAGEVRDSLDRTRQIVHGLRRSLEARLFTSLGAIGASVLLAMRLFS